MKSSRGRYAILAAGVLLFGASYYPNWVLGNQFWGDLLEFVGTTLLVLGACLIVRRLVPHSLPQYFLYAGSLCLVFARFIDFTHEIPHIVNWPLLGDAGWGSDLALRVGESVGYICILLAFLALLREVTKLHQHLERDHQHLQELHDKSVFLTRVADMSPEAVFGCDRKGIIRTWNHGASEMFGFDASEAIGMPLAELFAEESGQVESLSGDLLREGGPLRDIEAAARTQCGQRFWASASVSTVFQDDGALLGFSIVVRDIEARKEAERKLKHSRDMLASALHNAEVGMFIIGRDLQLLAVNPRMEELVGAKLCDFSTLSDACSRVLEPEVQFVERLTKDVLERGRPLEFRNLVVHRHDTAERVCNTAISPMVDDRGEITGAVCIVVDVTEREALQARLLESQKMESLGRLAGGIAHDFNNIIGGVLGYASLMREVSAPDSDVGRYAESIEAAASRAAELTQQLLAFARGKKAEVQEVDLNAVIDETLALLSLGVDPNISVQFEPAANLAPTRVDLDQINQLLLNLLINARDAIQGQGVIRIATDLVDIDESARAQLSLDGTGSYVRVSIEDDGCGMPADVLRHIFEPFFTTKTHTEGYGLGLSVVYGVVEAHGGAIRVDSEPDNGTRIEVYLPASGTSPVSRPQPEAPTPAKGRTARERRHETILVVDDEVFMQNLVRDLLEAEGYTVLSAETGEQSIDVFHDHRERIALVVMDLLMPGMGGAAALQCLREHEPTLPCIISSGYGTDTVTPAMQHDERIRFVPKPYKAADMVQAVRELLEACAQVS